MTQITQKPFGRLADGREATLFMLTIPDGMSVALTDYGASIVQVNVPDRRGVLKDVTLGYDDVSGYETGRSCFGCTIGRYGNRIRDGRLPVGDEVYQLPRNDGDQRIGPRHPPVHPAMERIGCGARRFPRERSTVILDTGTVANFREHLQIKPSPRR